MLREISGMKLLIAIGARSSATSFYNTVGHDITFWINSVEQQLRRMVEGPVIRYLSDNIQQLGGDLHNHNIYCRRCTNRKAGGFDPEYGILICANEMKDQGHLEDTMAHEMVHAYDHLRFKVDWTNNLRHAACTEVREITKEGKEWQAEDSLILCFFCHRFEPVRLAANADGRGSFSDEANGNSHSNIKNAFGEGLFYP